MDLDIPVCAMYRSVGTVIVRIRMDQQGSCGQGRPAGHPAPAHIQSGCERCNSTRIISKHNSDCDSVVEKCRPYSSSTARSRHVNVCAAVCLLLLVGGLSPKSSAAPHLGRTMDRQRRAIDDTITRLWDNPCDYTDSNAKSAVSPNIKELADKLVKQAKSALTQASKYKDVFADKLHSYPSFELLVRDWDSYEWLRNFTWYREEMLPKTPVSNEYMNELMKKMDDVMPIMYKGLKVVVAGLYTFTKEGFNDRIISHEALKMNITQTMHDVRAVLCHFSDIMKARNLEILPLAESDLPDFTTGDKHSTGVFIYRDTLNYLEYLAQVFEKFYETSA